MPNDHGLVFSPESLEMIVKVPLQAPIHIRQVALDHLFPVLSLELDRAGIGILTICPRERIDFIGVIRSTFKMHADSATFIREDISYLHGIMAGSMPSST
ncbi:hypothetical protein PsYK624_131830 [Phanerochaete sordida]|uniref:Uncharacterized protein n=1 Tax=Phanerochaete sordida TaxID=48140 RepID=A0A9P3LJ72_9APHY|nr:hypothetical protein PsYK624_131830 [Phanerochaete sordida]